RAGAGSARRAPGRRWYPPCGSVAGSPARRATARAVPGPAGRMNLVLLWPAGLAALAALAVPLLLHLRRAQDTQRVDFAALRWLSPRRRPRHRLRLREWLLLA